jgi:prephenate dehydratase
VLDAAVQDYASNVTRFVVIGRSAGPEAPADKTSLVFALKSTPGALFRALSCFALRDINLTKLESRPIRGRPWEYMFYADVDIARQALPYVRAVTQLGEFAQWVRTLGSYRAWQGPPA